MVLMRRDAAILYRQSDMAIGRTLLLALVRGIERKDNSRSRTGLGRRPAQMSETINWMPTEQVGLLRRERRSSAVQPEGPGAEPVHDRRMAF